MSEAAAKASSSPRIPVFPIACWVLGMTAFAEVIIGGLALARRLEDSRQVRVIEKEVPKLVPVEIVPKRQDPTPVPAPPASAGAVAPLPPPAAVVPQPTPIPVPAIDDPVSERLVKDGRKARVAGDMGMAILKLQEALKQSPEDPSVHYELGLVHEGMGIYDVASQHYEKVFQMGVSGAGALYELAARKLRDGFEQPTDWIGKLALGRVRIFKDTRYTQGERVVLTIPVQKAPGEEVDTDGIKVEVLFFNRTTKGEIVKLEDQNKSWVKAMDWVDLPFDFTGGEEPLRVTYVIPPRDLQTEHLFGQERYYGQVVTLTYQGEIVDVQAWPRDLAGRVQAPPSARPGQEPAFDQLPPDFNETNPLFLTPEPPAIDTLPPLPR